MDAITPTTLLLAGTTTFTIVLFTFYRPTAFLEWLQRKRYHYETTLALYMLTPTEKFIFNSILFLLLSLLSIAAFLYLPEHISTIAARVFYYCFGDDSSSSSYGGMKPTIDVAAAAVGKSGQHVRQVLGMS